jgi:hypothetical protein
VGQDEYTHRWDPTAVPDAARDGLLGPGKPFELADEDVLGVTTRVFKRRSPHLRAVLERAITTMPETEHLVLWDQSLTFADAGASIARVAD